MFQDFDITLIETRGKKDTKIPKGRVKAMSATDAVNRVAPNTYGRIKNSPARSVRYEAKKSRPTKNVA